MIILIKIVASCFYLYVVGTLLNWGRYWIFFSFFTKNLLQLVLLHIYGFFFVCALAGFFFKVVVNWKILRSFGYVCSHSISLSSPLKIKHSVVNVVARKCASSILSVWPIALLNVPGNCYCCSAVRKWRLFSVYLSFVLVHSP